MSGAVLTVVFAAIGLLTTHTLPRTAGAANLPWWVLTGGLYGAFFLAATTFAVPKLGSATMIATVVTGQVIFSLLLDRIGLLAGAMLIRR